MFAERRRVSTFCWLPVLLLAIASSAAQAQMYSITVLDTLPGALYPNDAFINNNGEIAGSDWMLGFPFGPPHAWYVDSGGLTDLHAVGGWSAADSSTVYDLNDSGLVVGRYGMPFQPVQWSAGTATLLPLLTDPGARGGEALAVNESGQIAGYCDIDYVNYPVIWEGGVITGLGMPDPYDEGEALGINDSGQAVGFLVDFGAGSTTHAFSWDSGYTMLPELADRGSFAYDINSSGQIVGRSRSALGPDKAVIWVGGAISELTGPAPSAESSAKAVNDSGQAVGWAEWYNAAEDDWDQMAYLWDPVLGGGFLQDLIPSSSGWILHHAYDINNSGQIVVGARDAEYNQRVLLLDPTGAPVPEPSTLALVGFGLLGMAIRIRRKQKA